MNPLRVFIYIMSPICEQNMNSNGASVRDVPSLVYSFDGISVSFINNLYMRLYASYTKLYKIVRMIFLGEEK